MGGSVSWSNFSGSSLWLLLLSASPKDSRCCIPPVLNRSRCVQQFHFIFSVRKLNWRNKLYFILAEQRRYMLIQLPHGCELPRWRLTVRPLYVFIFIIWRFHCAQGDLHLWIIVSVRKRVWKVHIFNTMQCRHPWTAIRWAISGPESFGTAL